ncbi:MAG: peptidylprolyl isomerase, partial [Bacteroidota bacterium]
MKTQTAIAFLLAAVFFSLGSLRGQDQRAVIDKVVAMVGGEYILLSEVEEQYALAADQSAEPLPPEARCAFLDQLLVSKLLYNQSKLDSIEVSPEELEGQLNARIERILTYMGGKVEQFEEYYGQSITATKEQFRTDLREQLAAERMRGRVISEVTVTPSEVKDFFSKIPRDSLPYFNSEVEVSEIVLLPEANETTRAAVTEKLNTIREGIVNGQTSFAEAARTHSMDGSRQAGGDLGWAKRGKFVPEFEAAAYNLEPGEISEVVETEFGYHILQLQERRGNSIHVSHILIRPEVLEADVEKYRSRLDSVRSLIVDDSLKFSYAVKIYGFDKLPSYNNDGRMQNPADGSTIFEVGDLDPDIYFTIDDMEIGDVSEPLEFRGPTGDVMLRIIQLQSRTRPHQAGLDRDYSKIQEATKQAKQSQYLSKWISETLGKTFIWIDPRYKDCPSLDVWSENSRTMGGGN